jgi:hypothetical protein
MASKAGGGINSRVNVRPPGRQGSPARGINPGHVAQTGTTFGNRAMEKQTNYRGEPKFTASPPSGGVKLGNQTSKEAGQGPGAGRVVYGGGTQQQHGPAAPGNLRGNCFRDGQLRTEARGESDAERLERWRRP